MGQFHADLAPYYVYLAPSGQGKFTPAEIDSLPQAPWVRIEDGDIAQSPITVTWDDTEELEEPDINSAISERAYLTARNVSVTWSMKNSGIEAIAEFLHGVQAVKTARTAQAHESIGFEVGEADIDYFSLLLLSHNMKEVGGEKTPSIVQLYHSFKHGPIERSSNRTTPTMFEVTFRGLKNSQGANDTAGKIGWFYNLLEKKGTD